MFSVLNLPNFITLLRIGAIPVFLILLVDERYTEALIVFILAGITDSLDGLLARWLDARTTLGAFIDPLADKLLLVSSFVILAFLGDIPRWLAVLVIMRDVMILIGYSVLFFVTGHAIEVRPTLIGKVSTFFQLLTVIMALVALHNAVWQIPLLRDTSEILAGATVTISGFQYLSRAFRWFNEQEEKLSTTESR